MKTTIQLARPTLERLAKFKRFERESYDEVLNFVLDEYEEEPLTDADIDSIKRGLADIKAGRVHKLEDVAKELGIKL
jgi:predicted transcriptional regulator